MREADEHHRSDAAQPGGPHPNPNPSPSPNPNPTPNPNPNPSPDPSPLTQVGRDYGTQYRHGVYPHSPQQMEVAKACVAQAQAKLPAGKRCHTEVVEAQTFWPAEETHRAPQPHCSTPTP